MDVVEQQQDGPRAGERLEQAAHGPVRLAEGARVRRTVEGGKARRGQLAVWVGSQSRTDIEVAQRVDERQERQALAVGDAAADERLGFACDGFNELATEPGLADPGLSKDGDDAASPLAGRCIEGDPQPS